MPLPPLLTASAKNLAEAVSCHGLCKFAEAVGCRDLCKILQRSLAATASTNLQRLWYAMTSAFLQRSLAATASADLQVAWVAICNLAL